MGREALWTWITLAVEKMMGWVMGSRVAAQRAHGRMVRMYCPIAGGILCVWLKFYTRIHIHNTSLPLRRL